MAVSPNIDITSIIQSLYEQARLSGACDKFTGAERTIDDIVRLFLSPQGIEFCMKHHFPNMAAVRQFKGQGLERYGIYIDAGMISLREPERVVLIGRTTATIRVSELKRHEIIVMHGAKAAVTATKWAVVRLQVEQGCQVIRNTADNAIILG